MTRDSGSERPQRTVAELLAEYGGATGDAPRRRRRRAEDDGDSAPQTIIERVLSDSGKLLPIRDDQQAGPRRPGGHRSGERRPAAPPPAQQQPPQGPPSGYAEPVRPPAQQPQPTGRQPQPGRPVQQQPAAEPQRQFPPSRPGPQGGALRPVQQLPPAPPAAPQTQSRPALRPPAGPQPMPPRPPAGPQRPRVDDDNIATAVHPPLPDDYQPPAAQQQAPPQPPKPVQQPTMQAPPVQAPRAGRGGLPPEATTEEFPLVPGEPQGAQATQRRPPAPQPPMESTQAHAGPYVDDDLGDFEDEFAGGIGTDEAFPSRDDDFDDIEDDHGRAEPFDADREPRSGTREWLLMAAQVGVGAIAGAAVWLAFSWLWGFQPVVGLVAAVLVIFGLVLGVRRWRRAEDLQTTVLAVLAGLVVTVSPAALLLLHR